MKQKTHIILPCALLVSLLLASPLLTADIQAAGLNSVLEPGVLITRTDAETFMGTAMKDGENSENKVVGQKICIYNAADDNSFAFLQISLTQNTFMPEGMLAAGQSAQTIYETTKNAFPNREIVPGLGDDAFIATPGIHILMGEYYLVIGAGNLNRNRDKVLAAGSKAVENLNRLQ